MRITVVPVVLGLLLAAGCGAERKDEAASAASPAWQRIEPGGNTRCARGGRYAFWLRHADPKRLLVFFQGGGGCFSVETCRPGSTWFDDRVDAFDFPAGSGGIFEFANPDNPFRDYSVLYIPSCSGDVHTGSRVVRYGAYVCTRRAS